MSHDKKSAKRSQTLSLSKGFTLVELLVIAPVVILVIGGFIGAIIAMTGNVLATRSANMLTYNIQDALDRIESDVRISGGFLIENNFFPIDAQGENGVNSDKFNASAADADKLDTLVLNTYATDANPATGTRNIIYSSNVPVMLNTVYFVTGNILWRRILFPNNSITAWQQPSCAPDAADVICRAKDIKLIEGIKKFEVKYYSVVSNYTSEVPINGISANENTQIKVTIEAEGSTAGRKYSGSGTISAVSPNNYFAP